MKQIKYLLDATVGIPERPEQKPKSLVSVGGHLRVDPYYWLNERENPAVAAWLEAENQYAEAVLKPVNSLRDELFLEMKARIQEDDASVPYFLRGYWYYFRFETGKEYPIYCRKKALLESEEFVFLDVNQLAANKTYCAIGAWSVSPDNNILAYLIDFSGRGIYESRFVDLENRQVLPDQLTGDGIPAGSLVWANDGKTLFYDTKDAVTLRNDKVWSHRLGEQTDTLRYEETDETAYVHVVKSKDDRYVMLQHGYTQNVETHFLDADKPEEAFVCIHPREPDFYYEAEHREGRFLIRTNWNAPDFRLMTAPASSPSRENWTDLFPARPRTLIENFEVFSQYLAILLRKDGLKQIQIMRFDQNDTHLLDFGEAVYDANLVYTPDYESPYLRYSFSSLRTPPSIVQYEIASRIKKILKVMPVLGGFSTEAYQTERVWADANDGVRVPISVVHRRDTSIDGSAPCLLVGYGSYGICYDPVFNREWISLLDRGFVCAIAHIRGGMEMGFEWYEQGKRHKKINTFTDFIACAEALCQNAFTSPKRLFASGRSAGGLLMGAVVNMRPDLFLGIITGVPFVDVVTTMSDPDLPLTTGEYAEWGNPNEEADYRYMLKYSPYDNLEAKAYPWLLVLTSFADSQVQYFEPAKYVVKIRDLKTDHRPLLFMTNMTGSHGGASGRFERLKERAIEYAWMLGVLGMEDGGSQTLS